MLVQILSACVLSLPLPLPGVSSGSAAPPLDSTSELALEAGRAAVKRGQPDRAREHFERALASAETRAEAAFELGELARAAGDVDRMATAALIHAEATVDPRGSGVASPRGAWTIGGKELDVQGLAKRAAAARVQLANALLGVAQDHESKGSRSPEDLLTAAWSRRFALDLVQRTARVAEAMGPALKPDVSVPAGAHGPVLKALDRVGARAIATGDLGTAIRAGRILRGLGVQADFSDLRGDRPSGMAKWRAKGSDILDKARERQAERSDKPWTVEDLEWLSLHEGESFTRSHSSFAEPGVAVSPRGYYRIESDCGYETLLAVARTIEDHHERLANYFGSDPFVRNGTKVERQGLIRIVPDPSGLEAEGAPFFWVGGFQSGDTTVVRLAAGTIEGLGRTLTHELTHRFDGALHGGIPAWLAEGRAVWTGGAYARIEDHSFVDDYASHGTLISVVNRGLSSPRTLTNILSGTPGDYRQNYSAGNALYVFLSTWFPGNAPSMSGGQPLFRDLLHTYEDQGKHPSKPDDLFEEFVDHFCDGKNGRPSSFDEFQEMFTEFLRGFALREKAPFTKRYMNTLEDREGATWIYDEPTWTWDWVRAEPLFGQNQAREAGALLLEFGKPEEAIRALVWARAVDGYDPRTAAYLVEAFEKLKSPSLREREALWTVQHERNGEPFASRVHEKSARARLGAFPGDLKAVDACLAELGAVAAALAAGGAPESARRVAGDAERVAAWAGERVGERAGEETAAPGAVDQAIAIPPGEPDELGGWVEESLTRLDEDRPEGLYFVEDDGTLLLGRNSARTSTGRFDRNGGGRSFVRASRWMLPGTYRIQTRMNFTTAYATGLIVLGWSSRERNIRIPLTAGDVQYAIGESDEEPSFDKVNWRFDGMRTREGGLWTSVRGGAIELDPPSASIEIELLITGPVASLWIAGQFAGSYHTVDGAPIEGYVGFGTMSGTIAVAPPIVRRLDRQPVAILDLDRGTGPEFDRLRNVSVYFGDQMEPPTNGALVLWIPSDGKAGSISSADDEGGELSAEDQRDDITREIARARRTAVQLLERMSRNGVGQPLVVAFPRRFEKVLDRAAFDAELQDSAPENSVPPRIVFHGVTDPAAAEDEASDEHRFEAIDQGRRWLIFVDGFGVARMCQTFTSAAAISQHQLEHWLTVFRDHGRPERKLPEFSRPPAEEDEGQ
ncbi:hypothetical protein Poly30_24740 [Planctomycetes bacterium Poly30]|uniref:Rhodanese domain-containing protein n=1 Tax=Saltatorellus ferox TaxID=2528018 RepID=A0A518ES94_9BACT|nr:hypothetical protein Poly30_24740 [Planctomycetes bacterium Poly30]